jgi:ABC-type Na+ transport system ATPase subunit NatA
VAFRKFLAELREGRAILFSSHILAEVAQIATRLLVIQDGQICLDAPLAELNARAGESGQTLEQLVIQAVSTGGAGASQ